MIKLNSKELINSDNETRISSIKKLRINIENSLNNLNSEDCNKLKINISNELLLLVQSNDYYSNITALDIINNILELFDNFTALQYANYVKTIINRHNEFEGYHIIEECCNVLIILIKIDFSKYYFNIW